MALVVWERAECVSTEIEGALVLLDLEQLVYHSLNPTAAAIWEALSQPRTECFLVEHLCNRFVVSQEVCRPAVARMLSQFASDKLVTTHQVAVSEPEAAA